MVGGQYFDNRNALYLSLIHILFDKERIYAQVCGYDAEGDSRTITELVRRIRKKIADYSEKEYIETVWGIGYRWKK